MNKITLNTNHLVINALTAIKNKNYIEAKNLLEKAISIQPDMFEANHNLACLLYTSDAADDSLRVDLGGRRIIKKHCRRMR